IQVVPAPAAMRRRPDAPRPPRPTPNCGPARRKNRRERQKPGPRHHSISKEIYPGHVRLTAAPRSPPPPRWSSPPDTPAPPPPPPRFDDRLHEIPVPPHQLNRRVPRPRRRASRVVFDVTEQNAHDPRRRIAHRTARRRRGDDCPLTARQRTTGNQPPPPSPHD